MCHRVITIFTNVSYAYVPNQILTVDAIVERVRGNIPAAISDQANPNQSLAFDDCHFSAIDFIFVL